MTLRDFSDLIKDDLQDPEFVVALCDDVLTERDTSLFLMVLRDVVKANGGVAAVAEATGLSRESLYKTLSAKGNPEYGTLVKILDVLGYRFSIVSKEAHPAEAEQKEATAAAV